MANAPIIGCASISNPAKTPKTPDPNVYFHDASPAALASTPNAI